jgi:flavin-dependent dehydrogenase
LSGPAGLFAALRLIELGLKPIVVERGKDIRGRRRDLKAINVDHVVNEDSNYCLVKVGQERILTGNYTRDLKKGRCNADFELLVAYGATRIF